MLYPYADPDPGGKINAVPDPDPKVIGRRREGTFRTYTMKVGTVPYLLTSCKVKDLLESPMESGVLREAEMEPVPDSKDDMENIGMYNIRGFKGTVS